MKWLAIAAVALLAGCAINPAPPARTPAVESVVWSTEMQAWAEPWRDEVARRYADAVVVLCHGGDDGAGGWTFSADEGEIPVAEGIRNLRRLDWIGQRRIVLVTCNPGNHPLPAGCGLVTYCPVGSVRFGPDSWIIKNEGWRYTGSVFEMREVVPGR